MGNFGNIDHKKADGDSIVSAKPGVHRNCIYVSTELKETPNSQIITILFEDENKNPVPLTYWDPKENADKEKNLFLSLSHFLQRYITIEQLNQAGDMDFKGLYEFIKRTLDGKKAAKIKVAIKILGSVYNGNANSSQPGYTPYIYTEKEMEGGKVLSISPKESASIAEYFQHISATPTPEAQIEDKVDEKVADDF